MRVILTKFYEICLTLWFFAIFYYIYKAIKTKGQKRKFLKKSLHSFVICLTAFLLLPLVDEKIIKDTKIHTLKQIL